VPGRSPIAGHYHGHRQSWATSPPAGVFRIADGEIAECWLVPFDQYLVDELWA
jgi:hypothetical protein